MGQWHPDDTDPGAEHMAALDDALHQLFRWVFAIVAFVLIVACLAIINNS